MIELDVAVIFAIGEKYGFGRVLVWNHGQCQVEEQASRCSFLLSQNGTSVKTSLGRAIWSTSHNTELERGCVVATDSVDR